MEGLLEDMGNLGRLAHVGGHANHALAAELGSEALCVQHDVTSRESWRNVVRAAHAKFGGINVLVNNAGMAGPFGPIAATDPDDWWAAQQVHVYAPLIASHAVLPGMFAAGGGRIGDRRLHRGLGADRVGQGRPDAVAHFFRSRLPTAPR